MSKKDELELLIDALKKREEVLINNQSIKKYNKYFDIMRKCARKLIDDNRQEEILPFLFDNSISIQRDVAGILFNCYPEICHKVLKDISEMTVETGLPKQLIMLSVAAYDNLKYGIPKDFP